MHWLPTVEPAALAQRADCVRESVVYIVEKHLIPAVSASYHKRHNGVQQWKTAVLIFLKEMVPGMRMCEACDQRPCSSISKACKHGNGKHERQAFARGAPAENIHACP